MSGRHNDSGRQESTDFFFFFSPFRPVCLNAGGYTGRRESKRGVRPFSCPFRLTEFPPLFKADAQNAIRQEVNMRRNRFSFFAMIYCKGVPPPPPPSPPPGLPGAT